MRILLVGEHAEDFLPVREIRSVIVQHWRQNWEQSPSLEETRVLLQQKLYGLVLLEYETGDAESIQLVAEFLHAGVSIPFLLLTKDADEKTVAEIIKSGPWNCVAKS